MKYRPKLQLVTIFCCTIFVVFIVGLVFSSCAALEEARLQREKRILEKRDEGTLMLKPATPAAGIAEDARFGESDHYTIQFAEDLNTHPDFDESAERKEFILSALSYMESLYNEMNNYFGFQPAHKIHVTFRKSGGAAFVRTEYRTEQSGGQYVRFINKVSMDFPLPMYERPDVRLHELTHAFTNIYYIPTWFSEGIAVLMQTEYAGGGSHPKFESLHTDLRVDLDGVNQLENWGGHIGDILSDPLTQWRYRYAYTLVSELQERYGTDFYIRVFELMEADGLHHKLTGRMKTSFVVYYFSQTAGEDLVPFFKKLHFKVRKLSKEDILEQIPKIESRG